MCIRMTLSRPLIRWPLMIQEGVLDYLYGSTFANFVGSMLSNSYFIVPLL